MIAFLMQLSQDPLLDKVWGVLIVGVVGQIVIGAVFMVGFVAVVRRSIDKDIPAKLQSIDTHIAELAKEMLAMRREVDKHGYQITSLERWREDQLDDTRTGRRPPRPR